MYDFSIDKLNSINKQLIKRILTIVSITCMHAFNFYSYHFKAATIVSNSRPPKIYYPLPLTAIYLKSTRNSRKKKRSTAPPKFYGLLQITFICVDTFWTEEIYRPTRFPYFEMNFSGFGNHFFPFRLAPVRTSCSTSSKPYRLNRRRRTLQDRRQGRSRGSPHSRGSTCNDRKLILGESLSVIFGFAFDAAMKVGIVYLRFSFFSAGSCLYYQSVRYRLRIRAPQNVVPYSLKMGWRFAFRMHAVPHLPASPVQSICKVQNGGGFI